jgi:AraC-like DNA-binding protein
MQNSAQQRREAIRYWHEPVLGGIDLLTATCVTHRFARHAHEEFVLAVYERGAQQFETEGRGVIASAGSVLLIPPGIAHTGRAADANGWSYRAFYPRPALVREVSADTFRSRVQLEALPVGLFSNPQLFARLIRTHQSLSANESGLDHAVELVSALRLLLAHGHPGTAIRKPGHENRAVSAAREFIHAHYGEPINGADIAAAVGLSLPHLMRVFFAQTGVPINVYLTTVRLASARELLLAGESAADVAANVGFVDQSHLIRRFRDAFGVTPGQYVRDSGVRVVHRSN